jgi:hypothetical protein
MGVVSYDTLKAKTTSRKITLVEFAIGTLYTEWTNDGPGIWKGGIFYRADIAYGFKQGGFLLSPFKLSGSGTVTNTDYTKYSDIGSVQEDGVELIEYASYALMYANAASWYFDSEDQILYVHMTNNDWIHEHTMTVGVDYKITDDSAANDLGNGHYEERLIEVPTITKSKDSHIHGLIQHSGGSFAINNRDGEFDQISGMDFFGQPVVFKHGFQGNTYAEFKEVGRESIEGVDFDWDRISFALRDDREKLRRKIPLNTFSTATYQYLHADDTGKSIPIFYGEIRGAPVICVNKAQGGTPAWVFKVCDTSNHANGIQAIDTVYVGGTVTVPSATDLAAGTFTLSNGDWDKIKIVTFDGKGLKNAAGTYITNPLDIIVDVLSVYRNISYNSTNYETIEWEYAGTKSLANAIGIWQDRAIEIIDVIEKICNSVGGNFIKVDNGKYTFRFTNIQAPVQYAVTINEYMEALRIGFAGTDLVTTVRVGWKANQSESAYRWNVQNDRRLSIFSRYSKDNDLERETYLTTDEDAAELGIHLYDLYDEAEPVIEITTKSQYMDSEIMDVVQVEIKRVNGVQMMKDFVGEIVRITKNLIGNRVTMNIRRLRDIGISVPISLSVIDNVAVHDNVDMPRAFSVNESIRTSDGAAVTVG